MLYSHYFSEDTSNSVLPYVSAYFFFRRPQSNNIFFALLLSLGLDDLHVCPAQIHSTVTVIIWDQLNLSPPPYASGSVFSRLNIRPPSTVC